MRTTENKYTGRQRVVAELRTLLARPYRDFIAWSSVYEAADGDEQERRREQVAASLANLSRGYLPRSMWLEPGTRKKIEAFIEEANALLDELSENVEKRGYGRARASIARRVTRELGPLRKEAETGLETELAQPEPGRWRGRLRRSMGR